MTLTICYVTLVILASMWGWRCYFKKKQKAAKPSAPEQQEEVCENNNGGQCGVSCFCDDKALERINIEKPVYFDDEELDAYQGIAADEHTPEAIEAFSEVLYTMRPNEIADWLHSLEMRQLELPTPLKDEVVMLLSQSQEQ